MLPKYWISSLIKRKDGVFVPQLPTSLADTRLAETQFLIWEEGTVHFPGSSLVWDEAANLNACTQQSKRCWFLAIA